jgi:anti-sigma-K factor RskA
VKIARLSDSLEAEASTLRELTGEQVSVVRLTSAAPSAPWAWMFWNHATNRWTFVAHNLQAAPPGKTYQLWLVTAKAKISAGTFNPNADGSAELQATYPLARDSLRAIAVTEEPAGGVPQPTGQFVITATVGQ